MKRTLQLLCFICLNIMLIGCQQTYGTVYEFKEPPKISGKQCISKCRKTLNHCLALCHVNDENCDVKAREQAKLSYSRYVEQRHNEGKVVINDLNSYYNPLQCEQIMCHCEEDYRACYTLCGGKTVKKRVCVKNCNGSK